LLLLLLRLGVCCVSSTPIQPGQIWQIQIFIQIQIAAPDGASWGPHAAAAAAPGGPGAVTPCPAPHTRRQQHIALLAPLLSTLWLQCLEAAAGAAAVAEVGWVQGARCTRAAAPHPS
jgi:hypothetical protein